MENTTQTNQGSPSSAGKKLSLPLNTWLLGRKKKNQGSCSKEKGGHMDVKWQPSECPGLEAAKT